MGKIKIDRIYIASFFLLIVVFGFFLRLIEFQIVEGAYYERLAKESLSFTTRVEPARGSILDRNGEELAISRQSFNVELYRPFITQDEEDLIILKLCDILLQYKINWIDNLNIEIVDEKYAFMQNKESDVEKLKSDLKLNSYATAENVMVNLIEKYKLQSYNNKEQRILAGVKYEMEKRQFSNATPYVFVKDIPLEVVSVIKENSLDLKGVDIVVTPMRQYIDGTIAAHIMGYTGLISAEEYQALRSKGYGYNDITGKQGVEKVFEDELRGKFGTREVIRGENGEIKEMAITKDPVPGNNVSLTIDKNLQKTSQLLLEKYIKQFNADKPVNNGKDADSGAIAVVNVKTGDVLALASYPGYDVSTYNKDYSTLLKDDKKPLFNRALQGTYNPGSIYKPVMAALGVQNGIINDGYTVQCTGTYTRFSDYRPKCLGVHGNIGVYNAMAVSCNVFFYEVGYRLGIKNIEEFSKKLGMGTKTGIEVPESQGTITSPELKVSKGDVWNVGDVLQAAIGQLDTMVTPLQMANYVATIASGGTRYKATILKEITDYNGNIIKNKDAPTVEYKSDNKAAFEVARKAMLQTTLTGSGRMAFGNYPLEVATKTGTPQSASGSNNGTFVAFGPYEDPEIAVAAIIEHAGEGYYISPMVKEVFDSYFFQKHLN